MKKIDKQVMNAVANRKAMHNSNTYVEVCDGRLEVYLHRNLIFWVDSQSKWHASNCGWNTVTTRARLNACLDGIGSSLNVRSLKGEMLIVSRGKEGWKVLGRADSFNSHYENPTIGAEVEQFDSKYSPDYIRYRVVRVLEDETRVLYGVFKSERAANKIADKIREGAI